MASAASGDVESPGSTEPVGNRRSLREMSIAGMQQIGQYSSTISQAIGSTLDSPVQPVFSKENVYSYFMFIWPIENASISKGSRAWNWTTDKFMAIVLVMLALSVQSVLLRAIFSNVVAKNAAWQEGILHTTNDVERAWGLLSTHDASRCVDASSLCTVLGDGSISCASPSLQLVGRWPELDTDGDGIWTYAEAKKAAPEIRCKYGVDATEAFEVIRHFVQSRSEYMWLHPDLLSGKAIHQPYFTYAMGDILMCGYRDHRICANLLERGFFEAPMKYKNVPRVGNTTESALSYCYDLLDEGGQCERMLPSSYSVWKVVSIEECKAPDFEKYVFQHPVDESKKSLLTVNFEARKEYAKAQTPLFMMYKFSLILVWLLAMVNECKDVALTCTWMLRFPSAESLESQGKDAVEVDEEVTPRGSPSGTAQFTIKGVTHMHRLLVGIAAVARSMMLVVLTWVGTELLMRNNSYIDLLFDAVSLVFVLEIANILHSHVLRLDIREKAQRASMQVKTVGFAFANRSPGAVDFIMLVVTAAASVAIMYGYDRSTVKPIYDALDCACLSEGARCVEAKAFDKSFWSDYWAVQTPKVFDSVRSLHRDYEAAAPKAASAFAASGVVANASASAAFHAARTAAAAAANGSARLAAHLRPPTPPAAAGQPTAKPANDVRRSQERKSRRAVLSRHDLSARGRIGVE
eukprot:TRINITY_DN17615_c0_g1_i1.p1 TRINITY_DN17615_c0_g1~~TRINITY_DN17615_c0_g1_i1.p1  ORF type:complete len:692 (-),score=156.59 TRINITY_DN17615_c0_g1_i1:16-2091(-)